MNLPPIYAAEVAVSKYLLDGQRTYHDTARDAWSHLASLRRRSEDLAGPVYEYSPTADQLDALAQGRALYGGRLITGDRDGGDAPGCVMADTPVSDDPRDAELVYQVSAVHHDDYPHYAGYMYGCEACEAKCWCSEEVSRADCVYGGDHV